MTTSLAPAPVRPAPERLPVAQLLGVAVVLGTALGVVDLALQLTLPYPYADLANSSAVWALCAVGLALVTRTTPARGALAGVVLLVVAVEAYYLAAFAIDKADLRMLVAPSSVAWMVFGVLAGALFGAAGSGLRSTRPWVGAGCLALVSAVLLAEAVVTLAGDHGSTGTVVLKAGLGVAVLLTASRRPAHLARAAALAVPLTALGVLAYLAGGF